MQQQETVVAEVIDRPRARRPELPQATAVTDQPRSWRRKPPLFALALVGIFVLAAILAPLVAPFDPLAQSLPNRLQPPGAHSPGGSVYLLGTDKLGRDILSRLIFGSRIAWQIALSTLLVGGGLGGILGLIAGYKGGRIDTIIMRVADGFLSFPIILLALLLATTVGPGLVSVILAISLLIWASFARLVRGEVIAVRERDWVTAARINGCSDIRILRLHIVPHVMNTWMVLASLEMGLIILVEASLSFLGAGIAPPTPAWGQMVAEGRDLVSSAWWVAIMPGASIMLLVLSFYMLGDWLREVLDPKLRQL